MIPDRGIERVSTAKSALSAVVDLLCSARDCLNLVKAGNLASLLDLVAGEINAGVEHQHKDLVKLHDEVTSLRQPHEKKQQLEAAIARLEAQREESMQRWAKQRVNEIMAEEEIKDGKEVGQQEKAA